MRHRSRGSVSSWLAAVYCLIACLGLWLSLALAQTPSATPLTEEAPAPQAESVESLIRPETVSVRRDAVQKRLDTLEHLLLSQEEAEVLKATLDQQVKTLAALETAFQKRQAYLTQLEQLPRQVDELNTRRQVLATRAPQDFPRVTDKLRLDYETQLQALRTEMDGIRKEVAAGELRLGSIVQDIEQRAVASAQFDKDAAAAHTEAAQASEQKPLLLARAELLDLRHQLQQAERDMLVAERDWLSKQGPLRDAQLGLAQTRYAVLQQDLERLKAALSQALSNESAALATTEDELERQLQEATDPAELLLLSVNLATIHLRKSTAEAQQQAEKLGDQIVAQERRNASEKHEAEHLVALVSKYATSARIGQRLQAAFTRLRHEQTRHAGDEMRTMEVDLEALTSQDLDLEERLYTFDHSMDKQLRDLALTLQSLTAPQREAQLTKARKALEAQKAALREQKQALAALVQEQTTLVTLRRDYRRILEESDQFVLTKLFWLRDGHMLGGHVLYDAQAGVRATLQRLQTTLRAEGQRLPPGEAHAAHVWGLLGLLGGVVPGLIWWGQWRLRPVITALLGADQTRVAFGRGSGAVLLAILWAGIWPAYLLGLAWAWARLVMGGASVLDLDLPLTTVLSWSALLLWVWLAARAVLQPQGWLASAWGLNARLCQALYRTLGVVCLSVWLLLIPRTTLLNAPGGPETVTGSLALARLCFTLFQVFALCLVALLGRRRSACMNAVLARSRDAGGGLWRQWPVVYLLLLAGMGIALGLDLSGYHYAAQALWLRSGEALLVGLSVVVVDHAIAVGLTRLALAQPLATAEEASTRAHTIWRAFQQTRPFLRLLLVALGLLVLARVYDLRDGLLGALEQVHLAELGRTKDGQPLWLSLEDMLEAGLILVGTTALIRRLPALCDLMLFPRLSWDVGLRYTFVTLSRYALLFLAVWASLSALHMNWSSIQWIVAAMSVGVGFGLQEIVSNFVSGLILLIERPIRVDDIITVGDQTGAVKRITIRATAIQNAENQTVIIPNKDFIAQRVINWTLGDTYVRLVLPVGVAYGSDMELVRRLLTEAVQGHPLVRSTPEPRVLLRAFGDHALQWEIWCFVPRPADRLTAADDLLLHIDQMFRQHGIDMPFPQQDVRIRSADATFVIQPLGQANPEKLSS